MQIFIVLNASIYCYYSLFFIFYLLVKRLRVSRTFKCWVCVFVCVSVGGGGRASCHGFIL